MLLSLLFNNFDWEHRKSYKKNRSTDQNRSVEHTNKNIHIICSELNLSEPEPMIIAIARSYVSEQHQHCYYRFSFALFVPQTKFDSNLINNNTNNDIVT